MTPRERAMDAVRSWAGSNLPIEDWIERAITEAIAEAREQTRNTFLMECGSRCSLVARARSAASAAPSAEPSAPRCPDCDGTGRLSADMQCGKCRGTGEGS